MEVKPLDAETLDYLGHQQAGPVGELLQQPDMRAQFLENPAWVAVKDGMPVCAAGVLPIWPGRGQAWAVFDYQKIEPRDMIAITRAVRRFLDTCTYARVEMTVEEGFEPGLRWAKLLGFKCETPEPMKMYGPDGENHYLFARVA